MQASRTVLRQILNSALLNILGVLAWGPGLILFFVSLAIWFKHPINPMDRL